MTDLILAYVPESEHLTYTEAQALALKRDRQAAEQLRLSVPVEEIFVDYDGYFRTVKEPLAPPIDLDVPITRMIERERDFRHDWMPLMLSKEWTDPT